MREINVEGAIVLKAHVCDSGQITFTGAHFQVAHANPKIRI